MTVYHYPPGLVFNDQGTPQAPIANTDGDLYDVPNGTIQSVFDLNGSPLSKIHTNSAGFFPSFQTADGGVSVGWIKFGTYWHFAVSAEAANGAAAVASALTAQTAAQNAQAAAQAASSAAAASAAAAVATDDNAIASAVNNAASATRTALNSKYVQVGGTGSFAASFVNNNDGGYTSTPYKLAGYAYVNSTFARITDAVGLSTVAPLAPSGAAGLPGTANSATRSDHQHPSGPHDPFAVGLTSGTTVNMRYPGSNAAGTLNRLNLGPLYIMRPDRAALVCSVIGVFVTTLAGAGGTVRFGLYKVQAGGGPDLTQLVFDSGTISSTTTGLKTFAYTTPIPEGLYWFGVVMQTATCSIATADDRIRYYDPSLSAGSNGNASARVDSVTGALPTSGSVTLQGDFPPLAYFTVA